MINDAFKLIKVRDDAGVVQIILARPPLNILNVEMMEEINHVLHRVSERRDVKAVVFSAEGKAFSAGVAIEDHMGDRAGMMLATFHRIFRYLHTLPCPTVAAVNGVALGGGAELAVFCDVVLASEDARFAQPEIKVGVFPPIAAIRYPERIGQARALQLLLSGEMIGARDAERIGLADRVVPATELETAIAETVAKYRLKSTVVLALTRRAVRGKADNFEGRLDALEQLYLDELMRSEDALEGLKAFLEKREPVWVNR